MIKMISKIQKNYIKIDIYIGENNQTHKVDLNKVIKFFNKELDFRTELMKKQTKKSYTDYIQGYTIFKTIGYWNMINEKSIVVQVLIKTNPKIVKRISEFIKSVENLRKELNQFKIIITISNTDVISLDKYYNR